MEKIGSRLIFLCLAVCFVACFAGNYELFLYALGAAFILIAIGIYKESKMASCVCGMLGISVTMLTFIYNHPGRIATREMITVKAIPMTAAIILAVTDFILVYSFFIMRYKKLKKCSKTAHGSVIKLYTRDRFVKRGNRQKCRTFYKEVFKYTISGEEKIAEALQWKSSDYFKVGDNVIIHYNPDNYDDVVLPRKRGENIMMLVIVLLLLATVLVAVTAVFI